MHQFTESNITLNFPDNNFFRFQDCLGYKKLSGNNFKEMDACWYDMQENLYWLFELKDFSDANTNEEQNVKDRVSNLTQKSVDSLCMFLSNKNGYDYWNNFSNCFPVKPNATTKFKFVSIIHCSPSQKTDIQIIHNSFRNKFKPYAELFGIEYYAVIEHSSAVKNIPNGMVQ